MTRRPLLLAASLLLSTPALAAVLTVNSTADTLAAGDAACTLREALANANTNSDTTGGDCAAGSGADVIDVPAGHYVRSIDATLSVTDALTLRGAGADKTVIDAAGLEGVIEIVASATPVRIEGVKLTGGDGSQGGGITSDGAGLSVVDSAISGNTGQGGGIEQLDGVATILRSLISENTGHGPGAGAILATGTLRLFDSTVSGNRNDRSCGKGICLFPTTAIRGDAISVEFSTIADNDLGIAVLGAIDLRASLLSNPAGQNCGFGVTSSGYNLDSDGSCGLGEPSDLSNQKPGITVLRDHGGPTQTHALAIGSAAVDAVPLAACTFDHDGDPGTPDVALDQDQRGSARPAVGDAGRCDIGAFEGTLSDDRAPEAVCGDMTVPTNPGVCFATPSIDAGSSDPDGDPLSIEQTPPGPYGGATMVTLRVTDPDGATDSCRALVTVRDEEPPVIVCGPPGIPHNLLWSDITVTENCGGFPTLEASAFECFQIKKSGKRIEQRCSAVFHPVAAFLGRVSFLRRPHVGTRVRTALTARDDAGNESSKSCEAVVTKK